MSVHEIPVIPSFGMSGEKDLHVTIHYADTTGVFADNPGKVTISLINREKKKIDVTIKEVKHDTGASETGTVTISAILQLPDCQLQKISGKTFDLIFSAGDRVFSISENAFEIYDSVAVLVHGFLASPRTWDQLVTPDEHRILYLKFDYEKENCIPAIDIVDAFHAFITRELTEKGYPGRFDIVCHSMGAQITRLWMLNYPANDNSHAGRIRQWIGIAPVTHGSANADGLLTDIVARILHRPAFFQLKTGSRTTKLLENNEEYETMNKVRYRIILGYNGNKKKFFYVWYENKFIPKWLLRLMTRFGLPEGLPILLAYDGSSKAYNSSAKVYYKTFFGDGVLANCLCLLPHASIDAFEGLNHSSIVRDQRVCALIRNYLADNPEVSNNGDFAREIERDYLAHISGSSKKKSGH
jgi:pimeloyl-ACP methyl ester carboxylesterase